MDSTNALSTLPPQPATQPAQRNVMRCVRRGLLILLLLLALLLGYKAVRVGIYAWSAYRSLSDLRTLAGNFSLGDDLPALANAAQPETQQLASATAGLEQQLRPLTPLFDGLDFLPRYGPTLAATPELLIAGREFTALAADGLNVAAPALDGWGEKPLNVLLDKLAEAQPQLDGMATRAEIASAALGTLPAADLLPALGEPLARAQPLLPLLAPLLKMAPSLPTLAGFDAPQTYLVVVQNNDELRGPGGFFTSVGQVTVANARPVEYDFEDSSQIWSRDNQYAAAPKPMQRFMNVGLVLLRDANWSPDLPTSARAIRSLYAQERGAQADGIITIDTHAVELIVEALEPLAVTVQISEGEPPETFKVTGESVTALTRELRDKSLDLVDGEIQGNWRGRKDFMPALVDAALARVQGGGADYVALAQAAITALDQRSIQLWMDDDAATAALAQLGWDGALQPPTGNTGDFLALVDSNLGYNKADAAIERSLNYRVEWNAEGIGVATAKIAYTHKAERPDRACKLEVSYGGGYGESIARCYFDYVRLYVPRGSELLDVEGVQPDTVDAYRGENGTQVFAGYFTLQPGASQTVTFRYILPPAITASHYALAVQRQSGTRALDFTARIGDRETETTIVDGRYKWP